MIDAIYLLRFGVALSMVVFGIHQVRNPLLWIQFLPEKLKEAYPLQVRSIMRLHGFGNVLLGLYLVSGVTPLAATWIALLWWLFILPFAFRTSWTVGMQDLVIVLALGALVRLLA